MHCKLQEKLQRVATPLESYYIFVVDYRQSTSFKRFSENMEQMFEFDDQCDISSSIDNGKC